MNKTLVLGIGNSIMQDDGVGVHVLQRLKGSHLVSESVAFLDGGTLSFSLIGEIENVANLIVIDAAQIGGEPGAVRTFIGEEMDQFLGRQKNSSVHDVTLVDLMAIASLSDCLPARRALVGIQPASTDLGTEPTAAVERAIPIACNVVIELIERWHS